LKSSIAGGNLRTTTTPGVALGKSFYQFRYNHFEPDEMGWNWQIKHRSKHLINETLQQYGVVMAENEIDLPPQTYSQIYVEPTEWQTKTIKSLVDEFSIYLNGNPIYDTQWVIAQISKIRQVCSGFVRVQDKKRIDGTSGKYTTLAELLEGEFKDHKIVIWCNFRTEITRIKELLKKLAIGYVVYQGGLSHEEKKENVKAFQTSKGVRCFIGQVAAGGQAITLTASDRVIYFSNSYSIRDRQQSEKRTHRIGSEKHKHIHYTDLITSGTIEKHIYDLLISRQFKNDAIVLRHLISKIKEGV